MKVQPQDILDFWFGSEFSMASAKKWFVQSDEFDADIRRRFEGTLRAAARGELDQWLETDEGTVAMVIVLDQFSRNLYRDLPAEYTQDERCLQITLPALDDGLDQRRPAVERVFLYLPLEHSEDLALQERSVELFERLVIDAPAEMKEFAEQALDFAKLHRDMIARFGRFPYRNAQLNRQSTAEELEVIAAGGWW